MTERRARGLLVLIEEGGEFPRGYGIAWRDPVKLRAWCAPIPLNWLLWALREAWLRLQRPPEGGEAERRHINGRLFASNAELAKRCAVLEDQVQSCVLRIHGLASTLDSCAEALIRMSEELERKNAEIRHLKARAGFGLTEVTH